MDDWYDMGKGMDASIAFAFAYRVADKRYVYAEMVLSGQPRIE